ncbi:Colicin V production protein [Buchnera aphidicola (Periphyllus testudinaceus)]|uniref:CvpA family protein n=1 Tax=Buchnera aphidicola TaxID=9 RepID=UPI0034646B9F
MNKYDYYIVFIVFLSSMIGLIRGFVRETFSLLMFFLGIFIFYIFYFYILDELSFVDQFFTKLICIFIFFGLIVLLCECFVFYFFKDFFKFIGNFYFNNLVLGFFFGFFRGFSLIFLCIYVFNNIFHINNYFYLKDSFLIPFFFKFMYFFNFFNKNHVV